MAAPKIGPRFGPVARTSSSALSAPAKAFLASEFQDDLTTRITGIRRREREEKGQRDTSTRGYRSFTACFVPFVKSSLRAPVLSIWTRHSVSLVPLSSTSVRISAAFRRRRTNRPVWKYAVCKGRKGKMDREKRRERLGDREAVLSYGKTIDQIGEAV